MNNSARKLTVVETLQRINDGGSLEELREKLNEAAMAVDESPKGKSAKVTLTICITKTGRHQVAVTDEIKVTLPKKIKEDTNLFVHPDGGFTVDNPLQERLTLEGSNS